MCIRLLAALAGVLMLAGCESTANTHWEKIGYGPTLDYADAQCRIMATGTQQGMIAWGSPGYVAGAQLGNAIGNAVREAEFMKNCMTMQGWKRFPNAPKTTPASGSQSTAARKEVVAALALSNIADSCSFKLKSERRQALAEIRKSSDSTIIAEATREAQTRMNAEIATTSKTAACKKARGILGDMKWL